MKERPIIFTAESVRAILAGRKRQTRRVMKPQPHAAWEHVTFQDGIALFSAQNAKGFETATCPYGMPGDRLWVREAWCSTLDTDGDINGVCCYRADRLDDSHEGSFEARATEIWDTVGHTGWRSPIFMPRWASRITLALTDVRVERLQDISLDDMRAEGIRPTTEASLLWRETLAENFRLHWDSINGKAHPWDSNPWVWVLTFEVVK